MTPEQLKNLEVFLNRVQLQGSEVPAFNDLIIALRQSSQQNQTITPIEKAIDEVAEDLTKE